MGSERADAVRGERSTPLESAVRRLQARASSLLAGILVLVLGGALLAWYYSHALTRPSRSREAAQAAVKSRAQGEMPLPSLGRIDPPAEPAQHPAAEAPPVPDLPLPAAPPLATPSSGANSNSPAATQLPVAPGHRESARERRLTAVVFAHSPSSAAAPTTQAVQSESAATSVASEASRGSGAVDGSLAALLRPGRTAASQAAVLPDTRFVLPKGAFIDCTLETAIDSTLPGMTTCVTAADTFGANGEVVLLERGTKLVGETHGQVQQGQARVFVLWTQARTPRGVVVALDSPGTDELGRAGLPGEVQRHFWQRFGAAMLVSLVDGAVQAGVQASNRSGGAVIYSPGASQDVLTEVLKDSLRIAPTVVKRNGERIQVLVARDLDFRPVYELRSAAR